MSTPPETADQPRSPDVPARVPTGKSHLSEGPAACWNSTGVFGDRTCDRLAGAVHCRDCPVFSEAVPRLLDRPLPEDYKVERTAYYAQSKAPPAATNSSAVLFRLGLEWFGLPTHIIQEVTESRRIHSIPHRKPGVVLGLANVRGELLTCVSLGHFLKVASLPARQDLRNETGRLVLMSLRRERYAFPAEEVHGVFRFCSLDLRQPPPAGDRFTPSCTQGVLDYAGCSVGFLNAELLFSGLGNSLV